MLIKWTPQSVLATKSLVCIIQMYGGTGNGQAAPIRMDQDAPLAACIAHYTFPFRSISQLPSAPPTSLASCESTHTLRLTVPAAGDGGGRSWRRRGAAAGGHPGLPQPLPPLRRILPCAAPSSLSQGGDERDRAPQQRATGYCCCPCLRGDERGDQRLGECGREEEERRQDSGEARGGRDQWTAVNPDCPNAANPFHRCAEYCPVPVPVPKSPARMHPPSPAVNGRTHSDGELQPRRRRRDKGGGSGGLPLYVFRESILLLAAIQNLSFTRLPDGENATSVRVAVREGSDGDGKKVDPRCPNAPNPFHVCTDHCLAKMAGGRASEGGKAPLAIFSRHSRRSSSSSEGCCFTPGSAPPML
jgi:hypothetical protein